MNRYYLGAMIKFIVAFFIFSGNHLFSNPLEYSSAKNVSPVHYLPSEVREIFFEPNKKNSDTETFSKKKQRLEIEIKGSWLRFDGKTKNNLSGAQSFGSELFPEGTLRWSFLSRDYKKYFFLEGGFSSAQFSDKEIDQVQRSSEGRIDSYNLGIGFGFVSDLSEFGLRLSYQRLPYYFIDSSPEISFKEDDTYRIGAFLKSHLLGQSQNELGIKSELYAFVGNFYDPGVGINASFFYGWFLPDRKNGVEFHIGGDISQRDSEFAEILRKEVFGKFSWITTF